MAIPDVVDTLDEVLDRLLAPRMVFAFLFVLALCVAARRGGEAMAPTLMPWLDGWMLEPFAGRVDVASPFDVPLAAAARAGYAGYGWAAVPLGAAIVAARWRSRGSSLGFGSAAATAAAALALVWCSGVVAHAALLRAYPTFGASAMRPRRLITELNPMKGGLVAVCLAAAAALALPWPRRTRLAQPAERGMAARRTRSVKGGPLDRRSALALAAITFAYWAWLALARAQLLLGALGNGGRGHADRSAAAPLYLITATAWTIALPVVAAFAVRYLIEGRARGVALSRLLAAWALVAHLADSLSTVLGFWPLLFTVIRRLSLGTAYRLSPSTLTVDLVYGVAALAIAREVRRRSGLLAAEPQPGGHPPASEA